MLRVLIADDHVSVCQAIRDLLALIPGVDVVGVAADGREAVNLTRRQRPDLIIMDARMPNVSGIEATAVIKQEFPGIRVVAHTAFIEPEIRAAMTAAGADDFVVKGTLDVATVKEWLSAR